MIRSLPLALGLICSLSAMGVHAADPDLAVRAAGILKSRCYSCHGVKFEVPGFDVLNHATLVAQPADAMAYVTAGDLDESMLWQRVAVDQDMPPKVVKNKVTEQELEVLRQWIVAGAPAATYTGREFIDEADVLRAIRNDLQEMPPENRLHQRYLSLHAISNNPRYTDADLRLYRAAVVKLLNSVSRRSRIVQPPMVDAPAERSTEGTVFRVDLRDFGWKASDWQTALQGYPFGLSWNDNKLQGYSKDIEQLVGSLSFDGIAYVRADWFVTKASRTATYHALLNVPETVEALEAQLGVDPQQDFLQDRLIRAGFAGSGVSHQNRLVDRHEGSVASYYYRSYDFDKAFGRGVLFRFPLGPRFTGNPHDQFAFEHAGGEIIWDLPNGMQGYMLIDADGKRIDKGPIEIVRDMREIAGTPEIVNAVSCIGCHRHGLLDYRDMVSGSQSLTSDARTKVDALFTRPDRLQEILNSDRDRFLASLKRAIGPYVQLHEASEKAITEFPEPISTVAKWYDQDMSLADVAAELGFEDATELGPTIQFNQKLKDLGLAPLASESTIPRRMWDTQQESPSSIFQRTAVALGVGSGLNPN
ncbi:Planctomycete cytochrome C [Rosistilla carotiformis]|uniref:Planctomycete cytochrome C n=1 Tax=Rosistilla carotiformis TaxID=2528017 RepID=A0A518JXX1_9BACT|nr:c-type cytochrome domain-containing protein [Rosistilla carotiformis]QDV70390.1 Planctomycete cytochrome C [Rosistilla carotiformis]